MLAAVDERRLLELERKSIQIPSSTFQEGEIADFYANYLSEIGLDVEMMEVIHPARSSLKSRQPIGRLKGTGGGPTLMLNGHMDPGCEMPGWSVDPYGPNSRMVGSGAWAPTTTRAAWWRPSRPSRPSFAPARGSRAMCWSRP